jgi:hypothetical protein
MSRPSWVFIMSVTLMHCDMGLTNDSAHASISGVSSLVDLTGKWPMTLHCLARGAQDGWRVVDWSSKLTFSVLYCV